MGLEKRVYSEFDYLNLTQLYLNNRWLKRTNHEGFEDLWFDIEKKHDRMILKELIDNFHFLDNAMAKDIMRSQLDKLLSSDLNPTNTLFTGYPKHHFPDGAQIILNLLKPLLEERNEGWKESHMYPSFFKGLEKIRKKGSTEAGVVLEHIVLIDDFVGTGGTASKRIDEARKTISETGFKIKIHLISLGGMLVGKQEIESKLDSCLIGLVMKKATDIIAYSGNVITLRRKLREMEKILHVGSSNEPLVKFSLGYGESESIYGYDGFNLPNNNFPVFWWNRYVNGGKRKAMFNRMQ